MISYTIVLLKLSKYQFGLESVRELKSASLSNFYILVFGLVSNR